MAFELVSFDDISKVLKLEKSSIIEYPPLDVLRTSVSAAIENHLARELESKERTESKYLRKNGSRMVPLKGLPVTAVSSVTITDVYGASEDLTENEDFRVTPFGIRLFSLFKDMDVSVTYTGGYTRTPTDTLPIDIVRAALFQLVYEYNKSPNLGAEFVETEGGSTQYPEVGLLKHVRELLTQHVHPLKWGI